MGSVPSLYCRCPDVLGASYQVAGDVEIRAFQHCYRDDAVRQIQRGNAAQRRAVLDGQGRHLVEAVDDDGILLSTSATSPPTYSGTVNPATARQSCPPAEGPPAPERTGEAFLQHTRKGTST
jgi:hypothetical protein